jgi:3-hydroxyacyl-CoA dehydrogenase
VYFKQTNPPFYAPLVEVIPSKWTVPEVTDRTMELLSSVGQVPVLVKKEVNGFVLNRIQYAIFAEAWRLIRVSGNLKGCCCRIPAKRLQAQSRPDLL